MSTYSYREQGQHGPPSPVALLLGAQLRSGEPEAIDAAASRIRAALNACGGNRTHAARALGVSWRTLVGWIHDCPSLQDLRRSNLVA